jgi:hypothetical protein
MTFRPRIRKKKSRLAGQGREGRFRVELSTMTSLAPSHKRKYAESEASSSTPKRLKSPTGPIPVTPKPSLSWFSVLYQRMVDNALPKYSLPGELSLPLPLVLVCRAC